MITQLQETWEIQNKVAYGSTIYYNYFFKLINSFLVRVSISNCHKLIEWIYREVEEYSVGFPGGSDSKESVCNAGDLGSIPGYTNSDIIFKVIFQCYIGASQVVQW